MNKMDEMEMSINKKAVTWSWRFTAIALIIWSTYDLIKTHTLTPPFTLLMLQMVVYFWASSISKWKMGVEDIRKTLILNIAGVVFFLLLFGVLIYFFPK